MWKDQRKYFPSFHLETWTVTKSRPGKVFWKHSLEYVIWMHNINIFNFSIQSHTTSSKCLFMFSFITATLCRSWNGQQWWNARISRSKHWCKNCLCEETLHCFTHWQGTFKNAHCMFWLKLFTYNFFMTSQIVVNAIVDTLKTAFPRSEPQSPTDEIDAEPDGKLSTDKKSKYRRRPACFSKCL